MENTTKELFVMALNKYTKYMVSMAPDYWENISYARRRAQGVDFIKIFNNIEFPFDKLNVVETGASYNHLDGAFGLIFGFATEQIGGKMFSVDINKERLEMSQELFNDQVPDLNYQTFNEDSVKFLTNLPTEPNLVHLDSWDLNLKNPLPSSLHGWREFIAVESKMKSGSLILIDDNFMGGTWVDWVYPDKPTERIDIAYPIIGKGALVYHYVMSGESDWVLVGDHYKSGPNIKLILQKK